MTIEEIKKKHAKEFDEYQAALDHVMHKREELGRLYFELKAKRDFPELMSDSVVDSSRLYDVADVSDPAAQDTTEKNKITLQAVENRLSYPITYDPEYRSAFKKLLQAVQNDVAEATSAADQKHADALKEYKEKERFYKNKEARAWNEMIDLEFGLKDLLFHDHYMARGRKEDRDYRGANASIRVDPVLNQLGHSPDVVVGSIDSLIRVLDAIDQNDVEKGDPADFDTRYASELAKRNMLPGDGVRETKITFNPFFTRMFFGD